MPAARLNIIVLHKNDSQVYGASTKEIALKTPLPEGVPIEDRRAFFISLQPDTGELVVHRLPQEEVESAEIEIKKKRDKVEQETVS